jgi:NodT family efflux transporter outer membrane factor (OMF) lipoprotein
MAIPAHYKETGTWVSTKPSLGQATADKPWWALFDDPVLNALEARVSVANLNLKMALAKFDEAKALALGTRSALYPTVDGIGNVARQKTSSTYVNGIPPYSFNTFLLTAFLTYEVDAWGSVRNAVAASDSQARASAFDLAAIDISLHAQLACDYFQVRSFDAMQVVLDRTVVAYQKALYLTRQRHEGGLVAEADVDGAKAQLEQAKTAATDNRLKRAQLEHAIAVLIGDAPGQFHLNPSLKPFKVATVSPQLPSTLLLHRPDVRAAAEQVRAANAQIGVARAAYFPQFNFLSFVGVQSSQWAQLFSAPSLVWSLGPSTILTLVQPEIQQVLFDGFKLRANLNRAKASYYQWVNAYKQKVLTAFKEVEDSLVAIHRLDEEKRTQGAATKAAMRALYQANQRYKGGLVTYLDVVVYENLALQSQLALIEVQNRRQLASVHLIEALGGGYPYVLSKGQKRQAAK